MINLPSLRHLRHLIALHDHGHFGRAAEACRVTETALSASIKELETLLDAALVDRAKRRVVLTPTGVETVERARNIVRDFEEFVGFYHRNATAAFLYATHGDHSDRRPIFAAAYPAWPPRGI